MDILNIIESICSIIGLFVSIFVASEVVKISNFNNHNSGKLNHGEGAQKVVEQHSILADNHSNATYNDYSGATIVGDLDEPPILTETNYPIFVTEIDKYRYGISSETCELKVMKAVNTMCFSVDFKNIQAKPEDNRWIGYSVKSLPMKDWRSFVNKNYSLEFNYSAIGTIKEIWIEITNFEINKKIYKRKLELSTNEDKFTLQMGNYKGVIDDWKSVDEICFVFFPEDCIGQQGTVFIIDMSIYHQ